jgi:hypothetical protein
MFCPECGSEFPGKIGASRLSEECTKESLIRISLCCLLGVESHLEALDVASQPHRKGLEAPARSVLEMLSGLSRPSGRTLLCLRSRRLALNAVGPRNLKRNYPPTNGKAGGKLPAGNVALRSPARSFSEASRKAATNHR